VGVHTWLSGSSSSVPGVPLRADGDVRASGTVELGARSVGSRAELSGTIQLVSRRILDRLVHNAHRIEKMVILCARIGKRGTRKAERRDLVVVSSSSVGFTVGLPLLVTSRYSGCEAAFNGTD